MKHSRIHYYLVRFLSRKCSLNFEIFLYFSLTSSETRSHTAHKCLYQLFFLKFHAKIKKLSWRSFLIQRSEYLLFHLICSHQWLALQTRSFNNFSKVIEEIYEGTFLVVTECRPQSYQKKIS